MTTHQLQYLDTATLLSLALLSAGIVLFIKTLQRRQLAQESRDGMSMVRWHRTERRWWRRYGLAAAILAIFLIIAGLLLVPNGAASAAIGG